MDITTFQFAAGGGVEIAIDAACLAKGNMDVDACHEPVNWLGCKYTIFSVCRLSGSSSLLVFNIKMDIEMRKACRMEAVLLGLRSAIYTLSILLFQYCLITFLSSLGMDYSLSLCGKGIE